ncbi:MAG: ADP-ribosylglycohydrolase family protein [Lentisphaerae bacterium]|nr:ADP-ribosylglycohydrolase family protein [Lentisphaerota bacterium]
MNIPKRTNWSREPWMLLSKGDLEIERQQCREEGKDLGKLEAEFAALAKLDLNKERHQQRAEALLDATANLPVRAGYPNREPSDLSGIRAARPSSVFLPKRRLSAAELRDKALGGWLGRACGCLLGKPAEGRRSRQIEKFLKAQKRWPLNNYFSLKAPAKLARECGFDIRFKGLFAEGITAMVEDDDLNYTVAGLAILKRWGAGFTPGDVAFFWLSHLPLFKVCSAERAAYRNLANGISPPASASFRNPYREWIGAQIRADFFGYVSPGNPAGAAEFAWRDAVISHVKNGIYGEMWVAAMIAAAYVLDDVSAVIRAGLAQIPASSRLAKAIGRVLELYRAGATFGVALTDISGRWHENRAHERVHTISNAAIVALALLWGKKDYEKTICGAVMPGFDTDCNGATAGSVLGVMLGGAALPAKWSAPLNDTLLTGVAGYNRVALSQMADETVALIRKIKN